MNELRKLLPSREQREKFARLIRKSPSPVLARTNLARLIESGGLKPLKKISRQQLPALLRLLGGSAYLSDILVREGRDWPDLFLRQIRAPVKTTSDHLAELSRMISEAPSADVLARALRRHKQREFLRIGARDLSSAPVEETMRDLSALAEASLETACRAGRSELEKDFGALRLPGTERKNRFVILGMGKLGGGELNFSSDIDILYLYEEDEGESDGGPKGKINPREFFHHLAERITRAVGEITEDGFVFRIDLRLRPLGRNGPLVQSLNSALLYYESWGQCWERAALIKARAAAGDRELGARFLHDIEPFVYRRYLDFTTIEELRHMKTRIQQELLSPQNQERNIKLGYGGIREIEFFTQALQLVNGGREPRVREHGTLSALELLARHGYIPPRENAVLSRAYRFLRNVEHKIQMVQEAHTHSIPQGEEGERALARRLGYSARNRRNERQLFWRDFRGHTTSVRRAFDQLFYGAQKEILSESGAVLGDIWNELDQEELLLPELQRLGFPDPGRAYELLLNVRDGAPDSPPSPKRLKVMRTLGPALIMEISKSGAPDQALTNFAEFSRREGARTGFFSLLAENPKTTRLLITLFASSQFLTDLFLKRPELLDSLIRVDLGQLRKNRGEMMSRLLAALAETGEVEGKLNAIRRYKAEELIRIALHDLGGALVLEDATVQLSELAEVCLEGALRLSREEMEKNFGGLRGGRFAILGMGKLGGKEIDYNSDLDLVFIYDAPDEARSQGGGTDGLDAHDYHVRLGQKLMTFLSAPTEEGTAYKIDLRLRPSGRFGPMVSSLAAFRHYHRTSSELWERQALIKARFVAGEPSLGAEAEQVAADFAYGTALTQAGIGEIHRLRMRMERELAQENPSRFNLKKGKGGMVDIEFLTQMLQLSHGHRLPEIRQRGTLAALRALHHQKIIRKAEYLLLSEGYLFLRRLDHRLRLVRDQSLDVLDREPDQLYGIAQALGYKDASKTAPKGKRRPGNLLLRDYELRRERIRACYDRFFKIGGTGMEGEERQGPGSGE